MKISSLLGKILSEALLLVKKSNHEFLTPEHLLFPLWNQIKFVSFWIRQAVKLNR